MGSHPALTAPLAKELEGLRPLVMWHAKQAHKKLGRWMELEDIFSELMLYCVEHISRYYIPEKTSCMASFLTMVMRQKIVRLYQYHSRQMRYCEVDPLEPWHGSVESDPIEYIDVRSKVGKLSPDEQRLVKLKFWEEVALKNIRLPGKKSSRPTIATYFKILRKFRAWLR